jgi:excinuclease ABC subunit B
VQTIGRAARNVEGRVILYADQITGSMERAIEETNRRRQVQLDYNLEHGVAPTTVAKEVRETVRSYEAVKEIAAQYGDGVQGELRIDEIPLMIDALERDMKDFAKAMEFEKAADVRDRILELRKLMGVTQGHLGVSSRRRNPAMRRR